MIKDLFVIKDFNSTLKHDHTFTLIYLKLNVYMTFVCIKLHLIYLYGYLDILYFAKTETDVCLFV